MASRTRLQLRTLVRTQLDMDVDELPDLTLDGWLEDGFERSLAVEDRWPFYEHSWTVTTVGGTVAYSKATIGAGIAIDQIVSLMDVTDGAYELRGISHDSAKAMFGVGATFAYSAKYWTEWAGDIYLWPASGVARQLRIDGYRKPNWAIGDGAPPDCDERLHLGLYFFACAMAYDQQEDEILSAEYLKHWQAALSQAQRKIMAVPQRRPVVLSGGLGW